MHCPNDNTTLVMTSREGIEIDYCPQCRGVWLDRGELDKIIERSEKAYGSTAAPNTSAPIPSQQYFDPTEKKARFEGPNYRDGDHNYKHQDSRRHKKHRKESFLSDIFDF